MVNFKDCLGKLALRTSIGLSKHRNAWDQVDTMKQYSLDPRDNIKNASSKKNMKKIVVDFSVLVSNPKCLNLTNVFLSAPMFPMEYNRYVSIKIRCTLVAKRDNFMSVL